MMKTVLTLGLCALLLAGALRGEAADPAPFAVGNQSPLVAIYGLPAASEARVLQPSEGSLGLTLDLANHYITSRKGVENLVLDGESLCVRISARYGLGHRAEAGVEIPLWMVGGGFLDSFIDSYHTAFGFPGGGRDLAPKNRLLYRYEKNGVALLHMEQSGQGLGDIRFTGAWQIYSAAGGGRHLALRAGLKLPTGDAGGLRGSGSTDLALWLAGSWQRSFSAGTLSLFGAAGALGMTKGRVLAAQQLPLVGFGTLGAGFRPLSWMELKLQTNAHTSFYKDSDLPQIDAPSVQLTIGGALHLAPRMSLDIGVTEDLAVGRSPDVVFHLGLSRTF
ncbi:MAG: DUF3187 family protein [Deltaproteobacteria bacterium]|nr:DUF3187 family protein [Deltaproteobacteria bacterium]